jgi:hypothetical protein
MAIIAIVILVAVLFGVLGALVKGLLWLLFIGIVLFVVAALFGSRKAKSRSR